MLSIFNVLLIAVSLSADSFAIALAIGSFFTTITKKEVAKLISAFMIAHFIMLLIGWYAGNIIVDYIDALSHWIILLFLGFVGIKLIYEAVKNKDELEIKKDFFRYRNILTLSLITSLDALAIGFSFALLHINILIPNVIISVVVGIMSLLGIFVGGKLSKMFSKIMKIIAGIILIIIGLLQLFEHYFEHYF
ncbi:MAG: manganese efflux pump MntP family protein [Bacteroidetes bacterium]|nr:manganese efflux pump MntP family protein [Bacteroidota bacterium]